jgi:hypothetical protein
LRRFVGKGLEIHKNPVAEIGPVIDAMVRKMSKPLQCILPKNNGLVRCRDVLHCSSGPRGSRIDGQPAAWILLGPVLVDVQDLEVRQPLNWPEPRGKCLDSARPLGLLAIFSSTIEVAVPRRRLMSCVM